MPTMRETWVQSLGQEDLLEKEMATHSSIVAWKIPWKEEPGGLQSMGSQRVGHDWVTSLFFSLNFCSSKNLICKMKTVAFNFWKNWIAVWLTSRNISAHPTIFSICFFISGDDIKLRWKSKDSYAIGFNAACLCKVCKSAINVLCTIQTDKFTFARKASAVASISSWTSSSNWSISWSFNRVWEKFWSSLSSFREIFPRAPGLSDQYSIIMGEDISKQSVRVPMSRISDVHWSL